MFREPQSILSEEDVRILKEVRDCLLSEFKKAPNTDMAGMILQIVYSMAPKKYTTEE